MITVNGGRLAFEDVLRHDERFISEREGDCVRCKFHVFDCCAPSFCEKHTLRSNECIHVKLPHHG